MADYYRDEMYDQLAEENAREHEAEELIEDYKKGICFWKPKYGEPILIQNMTNAHIINTLSYINKLEPISFKGYAYIEIFRCEKIKRGI